MGWSGDFEGEDLSGIPGYPTTSTKIRKSRRGCRLPNEAAAYDRHLHWMLSQEASSEHVWLRVKIQPRAKG